MGCSGASNGRAQTMKPHVIVTLSAFNEARNIDTVAGEIVAQGFRCIVVDDGSSDATAQQARAHGCSVVRHLTNLGQGWAVLTGFKAALSGDSDYIIEMDADGQHDPRQIPRFIERLEVGDVDIVVGSRVLGKNHPDAPLFRRALLPHFTWVINQLTGYQMTDSMCGFRAFRTESLRRVAPILDEMLEPQYIAAELFLRMRSVGLRVAEVPVDLADRHSGVSYKGFVRYGFGIMKAVLRTLLDPPYRARRSP